MGSLILVIGWVLLFVVIYHIGMWREELKNPYTPPSKPYEWLPPTPPPLFPNKKIYMASPEWATKRKLVLRRDLYTCQGCGDKYAPLEVHHISYALLYEEPLNHLVSVCRECHQAIHDKHGYSEFGYYPLERPTYV